MYEMAVGTCTRAATCSRAAQLGTHEVRIGLDALDLTMVKLKLMDSEEGLGWTREEAECTEVRYRRFLELVGTYWDQSIVPTKDIDAFWHQHILDTRAYAQDCEQLFGEYLHHFPYFGMNGEEDARDLHSSFARTAALYAANFGEPYAPREAGSEGGPRCVKCGSGPVKCHHQPTRCR
jgi:hypothetical protein